jgi:hypothetical protein
MAEAKGMSMVGNSWYVHLLSQIPFDAQTGGVLTRCYRIHKAKYLEDDTDSQKSPKKDKKKARSKSRTRAMFGLRSGA